MHTIRDTEFASQNLHHLGQALGPIQKKWKAKFQVSVDFFKQ